VTRAPALAAHAFSHAVAGTARAGPDAAAEYAERAARAARADAEGLRAVAEWGDRAGVPRAADADWEGLLALLGPAGVSGEPADAVRKRLRHVRRGGAWVPDAASWALVRATPDAEPARAEEYAARRAAGFARPSARRHLDLAAWCRAAGLSARADEHLVAALARDPYDPWARLSRGDVPDGEEGWVSEALRRRRAAATRAEAAVRRLAAASVAPSRLEEGARPAGPDGPALAAWRLREWRLETDLDDAAAAQALEAADLATRWFREAFGVPEGRRALPAGATFVVCRGEGLYRRVVDARAGLSSAERAFARGLGAFPFPRGDGERAVVLIERPDGESAADACRHYAVHLLAQAHLGVESREAWLYEGLAAYAARLLGRVHGTWCVRLEETGTAGFGLEPALPETWPEGARRLAEARGDAPLRLLLGASLSGLDGAMLVKSWSLLRWLLEERPDDARLFLEARRAGVPTPSALAGATGQTLEELDQAWRAHVLAAGGE
jgi:hypothetical protein